MPGLTSSQVLQLWDTVRDWHPLDRALAILAVAFPDETFDTLADLPVGRRDRRLLEIRSNTLGPVLAGQAECPACHEPSEFDVAIATLMETGHASLDADEPISWVSADGVNLRFRLPNSRDLAYVSRMLAPEDARHALVGRCLLQGDAARLTSEDVLGMAERMAENDPLADIRFDLVCPGCGQPFQTPFEIAAFLWLEIRAQAHRLLREVDTLARAYGWREVDILNMSAARRQMYLEMAW